MDSFAKKLLILVTGFFWFSQYTYVPILAPYAQSLGASYNMVGMIVGSYGLTQLLLRIPLGIMSDAWGLRKVFVIGGIVLAAFSDFGMWLLPTAVAVLFFRALSGVASSTWVDYTVLYASYFPNHDVPKALGFLNAVNNFGQVSAMLAGAYLAEKTGLASPFLLGAVVGGVGIVLSLFVKEERVLRKPLQKEEMLALLQDNRLQRLSWLAIILQFITYVTVFGFLPLVAQQLGASHFELGLLTAVTMVPSIFSSALSGAYFSKRFGERVTIVLGLTILSLSCLVIPLVSSLAWLYASQAVGGFARGLVLPLLMGISIRTFPGERRSTAMGIFQALYGLGMFLGPALAGLLSSHYGLFPGFYITGVLGLLGAGLACWRRYLSFEG